MTTITVDPASGGRKSAGGAALFIIDKPSLQLRRIAAGFALVIAIVAGALAGDKNGSHEDDEPSKPLIGIGAAIRPPPAKDGRQLIEQGGEVFHLMPNSPAALCLELAVGDLIVAVAQGDDAPINCQGREFSEVIILIRGPEGTEVRLTVIPADNRFVKRKVIALTRESLDGSKLVGKKAPEMTVTSLVDGRESKLSDFLGKIGLRPGPIT